MRVTKYQNGIKGLERINQAKKNIMKQALLILSLLLAFGTVQAQEESDVTWEETIDFIMKYSSHLRQGDLSVGRFPVQLSNFSIKQNILIFQYVKENNRIWDMSVDLSKLKEVEINWSKFGFQLKFTGPYAITNFNDPEHDIMKRDYYTFGAIDIEIKNRLSKAFSHLAKLATEKREAEREASGDKF